MEDETAMVHWHEETPKEVLAPGEADERPGYSGVFPLVLMAQEEDTKERLTRTLPSYKNV
jgi:hypothetical protein